MLGSSAVFLLKLKNTRPSHHLEAPSEWPWLDAPSQACIYYLWLSWGNIGGWFCLTDVVGDFECLLYRQFVAFSLFVSTHTVYQKRIIQIMFHVLSPVFPQDDFLYSVSIVSGITCAVLAVAKFMLGRVLTSRALITDGRVHKQPHTHINEKFPNLRGLNKACKIGEGNSILLNKCPRKLSGVTSLIGDFFSL